VWCLLVADANRPTDGAPAAVAVDDALCCELEAALQRGAPVRPLSPELERRYCAATWRGRSRGTRTWLVVVAIIDLLCLAIDCVVLPEYLLQCVIARGLLLTPLYLGAAALLTRRRAPSVQGIAVCAPAVALMLVGGYLGSLVGGVHGERYWLAGLFASFAATIVANAPFRYTVLQAVLSLLTFEALVLGRAGHSIAENVIDQIELVAYYPACVLIALDVRRWLERMHRRNFLLALRDELRVQQLAAANAKLTVLCNTDALTDVANRRFFDDALARTWSVAAAAHEALGVMMVDVDHFKILNDVAGHAEGDRCLQAIASAVKANIRPGTDLVARYGGEEFVVILAGADRHAALAIAERTRTAIERLGLENPGLSGRRRLTVSVGVASVRPARTGLSRSQLVQAADEALYVAKQTGRNRVCFGSGEESGHDAAVPVAVLAG
jgi:diguanylate cyclase (GGDEF)-like protein